MHRKRLLVLPIAVALALSLSACGSDADKTASSTSDPTLTAKGPETMSKALGERPGSPSNPSGLSDTSPAIPGSSENRPEKEQPFGQGSPQTSMKGAEIPLVTGSSNENKAEGPGYDRGG